MAPEPAFIRDVAPLIHRWGYPGVAIAVMLEDFGIPVPGETVLIAASVLSALGQLNIAGVLAAAWVGAVIGDNIGYLVGRVGGRRAALRWGRYVFLTRERLDRVTSFFERHGPKVVLVARFVEGLRQLNGIVAGISGMRWERFFVFNLLGAALWAGFWSAVAYLAGDRLGEIFALVKRFEVAAAVLAALAIAAYAAWRWRRRARPA